MFAFTDNRFSCFSRCWATFHWSLFWNHDMQIPCFLFTGVDFVFIDCACGRMRLCDSASVLRLRIRQQTGDQTGEEYGNATSSLWKPTDFHQIWDICLAPWFKDLASSLVLWILLYNNPVLIWSYPSIWEDYTKLCQRNATQTTTNPLDLFIIGSPVQLICHLFICFLIIFILM